MESLGLLAEAASHDLNYQTRHVLGGRNACQWYFGKQRNRYTKRKRKAIYCLVRDLAVEISEKTGLRRISTTAWRMAAKKWLEKNNLITILKPGKVLLHFQANLWHH